jgi:hypothetical protein
MGPLALLDKDISRTMLSSLVNLNMMFQAFPPIMRSVSVVRYSPLKILTKKMARKVGNSHSTQSRIRLALQNCHLMIS